MKIRFSSSGDARYFCPILMKILEIQQILFILEFHEKPFSSSVDSLCLLTWVVQLAFRGDLNAENNDRLTSVWAAQWNICRLMTSVRYGFPLRRGWR